MCVYLFVCGSFIYTSKLRCESNKLNSKTALQKANSASWYLLNHLALHIPPFPMPLTQTPTSCPPTGEGTKKTFRRPKTRASQLLGGDQDLATHVPALLGAWLLVLARDLS